MNDSIDSIIIILFTLIAGYASGRIFHEKVKHIALRIISPVVYILLFLMGIDIGWVFVDGKVGSNIIFEALGFALLISLLTFTLLMKDVQVPCKKDQKSNNILQPLVSCLKVAASFLAGIAIYTFYGNHLTETYVSVNTVLYFLIYLVGLDLVSFKLKSLSLKHLKIPLLTILGTLVSCFLYSMFSQRALGNIIIASSGYGWFTLSGPMISSLKGPELGMFAFLTDIFREMISIAFLYLLGSKYSQSAIGISGATALDSALPFIKNNCNEDQIKYAISSGFVLTLFAPLLIAFFSSLPLTTTQ